MKRLTLIVCLIALAASACGIGVSFDRNSLKVPRESAGQQAAQSEGLRIIMMDVGQGDAALIIAPDGRAILIDGGGHGEGKRTVLKAIEDEGIGAIEMIVATHYHEDHIGGIPEVIAGIDQTLGTDDDLLPKGGVYDTGQPGSDPKAPVYKIYEASAAGNRFTAHPGEQIRLGDLSMAFVAAGGTLADGTAVDLGDPEDENAAGIAVLMEYSGFRMLFGADITGGGGDPPYDTPDVETPLAPVVGDIDVLKVAHHGSETSSNEAFLRATKPEVAIISVGDRNDYGHPHRSTIERLIASGATIYQTERGWLDAADPIVADGDIVIDVETDGSYAVTAQ